jgi:tRNA (cmo5U34)-methyltransferase
MESEPAFPPNLWNDHMTRAFIDYGAYFVPERLHQFEIMGFLVPQGDQPIRIVDLCCGEGIFAGILLEKHPACTVYGLDGSAEMLQRAQARLAGYVERFQASLFNLADPDWPGVPLPVQAVFSSLAIHHLDGSGKQELFQRVFERLSPGGVFVIADILEPAHPVGRELAANEWDSAVRENALRLDGHLAGFEVFQQRQWNSFRFFDPDDIDRPSPIFDQLMWLAQAGFSGIDVFWMRAGYAIFGGNKMGE